MQCQIRRNNFYALAKRTELETFPSDPMDQLHVEVRGHPLSEIRESFYTATMSAQTLLSLVLVAHHALVSCRAIKEPVENDPRRARRSHACSTSNGPVMPFCTRNCRRVRRARARIWQMRLFVTPSCTARSERESSAE